MLVYLLIELQVLLSLVFVGSCQLLQARRSSIVVPPLPSPHVSEYPTGEYQQFRATLLSQCSKTNSSGLLKCGLQVNEIRDGVRFGKYTKNHDLDQNLGNTAKVLEY